jgi:hypothetical protein
MLEGVKHDAVASEFCDAPGAGGSFAKATAWKHFAVPVSKN